MQQVVETSVQSQIPSLYTQTIIYESKQKKDEDNRSKGKSDPKEEQGQGAANTKNTSKFTKTQKYILAAEVAAAVGVGAVVLLVGAPFQLFQHMVPVVRYSCLRVRFLLVGYFCNLCNT